MDGSNQLNFSYQLFVYTIFIAHIVVVLFVAAVYLYAYKFFDNRFYIPIAIGWLVNACYLGTETASMLVNVIKWPDPIPDFLTAILGLASIPFFHYAIRKERAQKETIFV